MIRPSQASSGSGLGLGSFTPSLERSTPSNGIGFGSPRNAASISPALL
jgi:hypothetical protein